MANLNEVLEALSTKEQAIKPEDLAKELRASVEGTRKQLNRLKEKEFVEGDSKEGWYLTDTGRKFLGTAKKMPLTKQDVGEDELSRFQWYGQLSGVNTDVITASAELFQNTDMRSMAEVERVLAEMNVPGTQRSKWINLYRGYLRNTTAPEKREELYPLPTLEEVRAADVRAVEGGERLDYIVEDNNILLTGDGLGMFTFKQALQVVAAKRGTTPQVAQAGQQGQPLDADGVIKIVNAVREWGGQGGQAAPKSYIVTPGEEGAIVQEAEPGKPVVLSTTQASKPSTYLVNPEGEVKEIRPGEPIVIKQQAQPSSQKTFIVRQTEKGIVAEEHELGKPIIINPAPGSGMVPMYPFPVMDASGKPVVGQDGQPVYANLEPMLKYLGFQSEQRRADERHTATMSLVETVKENLPDGIQALREAIAEARKSPQGKTSQEQEIYECGECNTKFSLSREPAEGETVACPNCGHSWSPEELAGT